MGETGLLPLYSGLGLKSLRSDVLKFCWNSQKKRKKKNMYNGFENSSSLRIQKEDKTSKFVSLMNDLPFPYIKKRLSSTQ
jgi:hypothetical protein